NIFGTLDKSDSKAIGTVSVSSSRSEYTATCGAGRDFLSRFPQQEAKNESSQSAPRPVVAHSSFADQKKVASSSLTSGPKADYGSGRLAETLEGQAVQDATKAQTNSKPATERSSRCRFAIYRVAVKARPS